MTEAQTALSRRVVASPGWRAVETVRWTMVGEGATEAEALVAALESAP